MGVLRGLLCASLAVAPVQRFPFFQPLDPPRPFQVMAHRGMMRQAPENTRPALERAVEDGIEWVEVDVRLTADGQHVLLHSERLDGVTNGSGPVVRHTLAELQQLDAGSWFAPRYTGERLLTLTQGLEIARGRVNLYLDCKHTDPSLLVREILDAQMERQVVVYDDLEALRQVRQLSRGQVAIMPKWRPTYGLKRWIETVHPEAVEIDAEEVTPEVCRAFHQHGVWVQAKVLDQCDRPQVWDRVLDAGVDWLQTDLPEEIIAHRLWKQRPQKPVMISLHRGALRYAPENTLAAFEKAARLGADYVECDVRTTRDGRFFLLHDRLLDRTTNGQGAIAEADSAAVAALDAGSWFGRPFAGTRLMTFEELLAWLPAGMQLYIDAKDSAPEALARLLRQYGMLDRLVVFDEPDALARLKAIEPHVRLMPPLGNLAEVEPLAHQLQPYAFDTAWEILSPKLIARCHELGIKVFSDALGRHETIEDYRRAIEWGIDLIQTDHPLRVIRAVELGSPSP